MTPYGAPERPPAGWNERVRRQIQVGFRHLGTATASWRCDPDYLIIGTKRGGTTSMARWLLDHPGVRPLYPARERRKGTYFFDVNYGRGHGWYRSHFPTRVAHRLASRRLSQPPLIGDATPYYLHHPHAPRRAGALVPHARVVVLLRNPVDRAYGHWAERSRNGVETLGFSEALRIEADRLAGEEQRMLDDPSYVSFAHQHFSYADQGRYARGLARWREVFPADQLLILRSEDLYRDPTAIYGEVLDFLGLPSHSPDEFAAWNLKPKDPISTDDRQFLIEALSDDVAQLEELLGRSMDWEGFES